MFYFSQCLGFLFFISFTTVSYSQTHSSAGEIAVSTRTSSAVNWDSLTKDEQAQVLLDLDYLTSAELPLKTKVINYLDPSVTALSLDDLKINNQKHKAYVEKLLSSFESEVSREEIEQSEYSAYGESQISALYLLVDESDNILGSILAFYQDGRDEEGEEADINWQASLRFDSQGDVLLNDEDESYDELYFEWSGH